MKNYDVETKIHSEWQEKKKMNDLYRILWQ